MAKARQYMNTSTCLGYQRGSSWVKFKRTGTDIVVDSCNMDGDVAVTHKQARYIAAWWGSAANDAERCKGGK